MEEKTLQQSLTVKSGFGIELHSPTLLESDKGEDAVRFTLSLTLPEVGRVLSIPGWRIMKGDLQAPARKLGKFNWIANVEFPEGSMKGSIIGMLEPWEDAFTTVRFPA